MSSSGSEILNNIERKVTSGERIDAEEGEYLYREADLADLARLASLVRTRLHGEAVFFNRNFHLEPTNHCIYDCKFCSYSRALKDTTENSWLMSEDDILEMVRRYDDEPVTEVHIVGGVHPRLDLAFFGEAIRKIKLHRPELHVKAFTPVELYYMFKKAKVSNEEGLRFLKSCGLNSLPGGGAEIFDEAVRKEICADKCSSADWLAIHEQAHRLGIPSNATMLYGHLESYAHRIDHMNRLRELQDRTRGFNTFIPLKFRNKNNQMSHLPEVSREEDLRNYAVARIFLDNIPHLKAYWPMIGRDAAQASLAYGVDDLDGTIDDTTKIYSMAGSEEINPSLSTNELVELIKSVGRDPIERDTLYRVLQRFDSPRETTEVAAAN